MPRITLQKGKRQLTPSSQGKQAAACRLFEEDMQLDDIRLKVNELKEYQERGSRNAAALELLLLWGFV